MYGRDETIPLFKFDRHGVRISQNKISSINWDQTPYHVNSTHTQCHFNGREISQGHFRPLIKKDLYSKKLKKVGLHHARLGTKRRRKTWIESNIITSLPSLLYSKTSLSLIPSIPCIHNITLPYITWPHRHPHMHALSPHTFLPNSFSIYIYWYVGDELSILIHSPFFSYFFAVCTFSTFWLSKWNRKEILKDPRRNNHVSWCPCMGLLCFFLLFSMPSSYQDIKGPSSSSCKVCIAFYNSFLCSLSLQLSFVAADFYTQCK